MLIKRDISDQLIEASKEFAAIAILGPRQSGKTTLAQITFPNHKYISFEDLDIRSLAKADPRKLKNYKITKIILCRYRYSMLTFKNKIGTRII